MLIELNITAIFPFHFDSTFLHTNSNYSSAFFLLLQFKCKSFNFKMQSQLYSKCRTTLTEITMALLVINQIFVTLNSIAWVISWVFYAGNHTLLVLCAQLCCYIKANCIIQCVALHFPQLINSVLGSSVICFNKLFTHNFSIVSL